MAILAVTGILALLLAAEGVYAVVSYATSRRTREIGIRMALGATRGSVQGMVLGEGMRMAATGIAIGLAAALIVIRVLRGVLVGLACADAITVAIAVILVTSTAVVACMMPARHATRIEPMSALRHE
jgi:ABC-type antimicrobial peptide transport system permease subunit